MYDLQTAIRRTELLARSLLAGQGLRPDAAPVFVAADGFPSASHGDNARLLAALVRLYLEPASAFHRSSDVLERIERAIAFQLESAEPHGLIDLVSTNWQSPPDTAFTIQLLAPLVDVIDGARPVPGADRIRDGLLRYLARTAPALVDAGFHTPNHRWVVCSALALAARHLPGLRAGAYVDRILEEGIDSNEDGEYSERSTGTYAAVSNRSLIFVADALERPRLLDPVRANLGFMARLFHHDGTIVTAMSQRQDRGTRVVPIQLASIYLEMAHRDDNDEWRAIADMLVDASAPRWNGDHGNADLTPVDPAGAGLCAWLLHPFHRHPDLRASADAAVAAAPRAGATPCAQAPRSYEAHFARSGIYRVRDGEASVTVLRGDHGLLDLVWGQLHVAGARLAGSYFAKLRFAAATMERTDDGVRLEMPEDAQPRVGYQLPVGRKVPYDEALLMKERRPWIDHPRFALTVDVARTPAGIMLRIRSAGGRAGVPCELELCAHGATRLESPGASTTIGPGATAVVNDAWVALRTGAHALRVGPGSRAHRTMKMRGAEGGCTGFRLLVPMLTPLDEEIAIEWGYWSEPDDAFVPARTE
ncbi:MAG: hypothetical protein ACOCW3_04935 [Spirochaetota bacterium]